MNDPHLTQYIAVLIQSCLDGERGFSLCAGHAEALSVQWLLTQRAQQYRKASVELQVLHREYLLTQPVVPQTPGDVGTQRGWVAAKSVLAGFSDVALLAECERGESSTIRQHQRVLDEDLPIMLRAVVQRQCDAAQRQRSDLRSLRATLLNATPQRPDQRPSALTPRLCWPASAAVQPEATSTA